MASWIRPTFKPEELVDLAHPARVAPGQVVVDRDDVDALAGESVEVDRHRGRERLALAGLHLGDLALVQNDTAHHLHVERSHPEGAFGGLPHDGEGLGQDVLERLVGLEPVAELVRLGPQLGVREPLHLGLQCRDGLDALLQDLDLPALAHPQYLRKQICH